MPIGRYIAFVGSVLLILLFVADWYMPKMDVASAATGTDKTAIRINSRQKWPDAVVFDTSLKTIVPPVAVAAVPASAPSLNDALAFAPEIPAQVAPATTVSVAQPAPKRVVEKHRVKVARAAPRRLVNDDGMFSRNPSPWEW